MSCYYKHPWIKQDEAKRASFFKRILYVLARPMISAYGKTLLSSATIKKFKPTWVLLERGMPLESRRQWGSALCHLRQAILLVQGTGTGWDVLSWARLKPKKIIAVDAFSFDESWNEISTYCDRALGVKVEFYKAPLENLRFLPSSSVDLCVSDAVFEHCQDLESVLREASRILKPGGSLYASYGPLWFAPGGDHFSGRGGLRHSYNHLLLGTQEYKKYFKKFLSVNENFQSGGRYVELDLFSRLTTGQYRSLFEKVGFCVNRLILEVSPNALKFRKAFPELFAQLEKQYADRCTTDDFLIKANLVRLVKSSHQATT